MLFDNAREARAFCLKHMGSDLESREAISAAIAPAIQFIDTCIGGFEMRESDIRGLLRDDLKFQDAIIDYIFDRYAPEFTFYNHDGYIKSISRTIAELSLYS